MATSIGSLSGGLSDVTHLTFVPVGHQFSLHVISSVKGLLPSDDPITDGDNHSDDDNDGNSSDGSSDGDMPLNTSIEWKDQDHYAMLGLGKVRYKASPKDIRKAYQQQVLIHHPDKQDNNEDTTFKKIQVAYEILVDPKRRRGYDSVDPTFSDNVPSISSHSKENFYDLFSMAFQDNSRWSSIQPVPSLGDCNTSLSELEDFYGFWYNFSSWREFSFLDEENADKAENREERRWMEKQNKAARQKRKKEEMARIRTLVDNAYACDPRVKYFKDKEKEEKESQKKAKQEAAKLEALKKEKEVKRKEEEERKKRELEQEQQRQLMAQQKQERDMHKKAIRKERKEIKALCKEKDYFKSSGEERIKLMESVDHLCEALPIISLREFKERLSASSHEESKQHIEREIEELMKKEREEEKAKAATAAKVKKESQAGGGSKWLKEEAQLLVKAVTLYPAGTAKRWGVIAEFINTHSPDGAQEKMPGDVIDKVKSLRKLDNEDKGTGSKEAFDAFEQKHSLQSSVTIPPPTLRDVSDLPHPWTGQEQKKLEEALRKYPSSTTNRWDCIAEMVATRSKEECIARFKELVAKVKMKKTQN